MPSYAVLGATGSTGQSLLRVLAKHTDKQINAFVRSRAKLEHQQPELVKSPHLHTFEGDISDSEVLTNCIRSCKAVFVVVAVNDNIPECRIAQDAAQSVVAAMEKIRSAHPGTTLPRLIVLSSASTDEHLCRNMPGLIHALLFKAFYWIYTDLLLAERFLRSNSDWIDCTFVKPGGLVHDEQKGHELSLDRQQTFLSFMDLAGGMLEVADAESDQWVSKNVSVVPTSAQVKIEWWVGWYMLKGLLFTYFPSLYFLT